MLDINDKKFRPIFDDLNEAIYAYGKAHISDPLPPDEELTRLYTEALRKIGEYLKYLFVNAKIQDEFQYKTFVNMDPDLEAHSLKMGTLIAFGIQGGSLYMATDIKHLHLLRNTGDEFWVDLAELAKQGDLSIEPNDFFLDDTTKRRPVTVKKYARKASQIYKFASALAIAETFGETDHDSFASVIVYQNEEEPYQKFLLRCDELVKILYRLNYRLYKVGQRVKK